MCDAGKLRMVKSRSDILACLEKYYKDVPEPETRAHGDDCALIMDRSALVHMLSPGLSKTFKDYLVNIMCLYVEKLLHAGAIL